MLIPPPRLLPACCNISSCFQQMLRSAGIDAKGLPADLDCHHLIVNDFEHITAEQNVCIASIPTVFNPELAPEGKALIHAYYAANEPYSRWEGLDRRSTEYKQLKVGRMLFLGHISHSSR